MPLIPALNKIGDIPISESIFIGGGGPWFDVKAPPHGAEGLGIADDTARIQHALDACANSALGGVVFFPYGIYRVTADLIVGSNTTLLGVGRGGSVIRRDATTAVCNVIRNANLSLGGPGPDSDIHLEGLTVWRAGEAATPNTTYDNAVRLTGVIRPSVNNCRIRGGAKALHIEGCLWPSGNNLWLDSYVDGALHVNWNGAAFSSLGEFDKLFIDTPVADGFALGSSALLCSADDVRFSNIIAVDAATNLMELVGKRISVAGVRARWTGKANVHNNIFVWNGNGSPADDLALDDINIEQGDVSIQVAVPNVDLHNRVHLSGIRVKGGQIAVRSIAGGSLRDFACQGSPASGVTVAGCSDFSVEDGRSHGHQLSGYNFIANGTMQNVRVSFRNLTSYGNALGNVVDQTYDYKIDNGDSLLLEHCRGQGGANITHNIYYNAGTNIREIDCDLTGFTSAPRRYTTAPVFARFRGIGAGSPLNVVVASPGGFWQRTDGGAGTSIYVKEAANDATGWVAK